MTVEHGGPKVRFFTEIRVAAARLGAKIQKWADSDEDYEYVKIERNGKDFMKRINDDPLMVGFIIQSLMTAGHPSLQYSRKKKEKN